MRTTLTLLLTSLLFMQCQSSTSTNDNGPFGYRWIMSPFNNYYKNQIDSTTTPRSLYLETGRYNKGSIGFVAPLMKKGRKASDVSIQLNYKTQDCSDLYIKITGIVESEKIVSTDTLRLPFSSDFATVEQSITLDSALLMNLSIEAKGRFISNAESKEPTFSLNR